MEQLITIELFGQPYQFRAAPETKNAQEIADMLVREVKRIQEQQAKATPGMTQTAILIMAALNLANENRELKQNHVTFQQVVSQRSELLNRLLDAELN